MERSRIAGFSLIELMTVVAVLGVLSAIAIPSYMGYTRRARASEATENVSMLFRLSASYYNLEHAAAHGHVLLTECTVESEGPVPSTPGVGKHVVQWGGTTSFAALGFGTAAPVQYAYEIVSAGGCSHEPGQALYSFRATGDLDGDGITSLYEVAGGASDQNVLLRSPSVYVRDAEE
ncbi:MAG: type IV pilin protein [Sandaracinaceae bacterium]